ncbi:HNH endonuclease [Pseudomonas sp. MAP12]|uniref:HNH endonuclease n=1 Tax=Geopseudomonas aromaticivorans TaxID=2849492 RepID=A0ABS6MTC8_9GAMM|nr:HNH endonuclease [Pseudomonas aromaticivorans]MBV2132073.1 HNH endonuclease [Pseudomonas aromaticivorans]
MLSIQEVITTLENAGFARPAQSGLKVVRLEHPGLFAPVFVKQSSSIHARLQAPLVLHPQYEEKLAEWLSISGLERGNSRYYHNSNLRGFPKRLNGGATEIAYGVDLGFRHMAALEEVISQLLGQPQGAASALEGSISSAGLPDDLAVTDTEREALIKARIGQGDYRYALLAYWGGCAVTDCTIPALLRASHIKPWRAASAGERLDPYNGLLLTPNLDLAFDQGLISFDDYGQILLGSDLDPDSARALNLHSHLRLRQIEARHQGYLAWHRDNLFRK